MRVTAVSICATEKAKEAGKPELTPELLAASGARYSRNNEGLDAILSKIDPNNIDKSVDSIFRMADFGHASILDMCPISMFMDDVSIWLAYYIWSNVNVGGGQESSTRYIRLNKEGLYTPPGIEDKETWMDYMNQCFEAYEKAVKLWEGVAESNPEVMNIPKSILDDSTKVKQVERMKRNFAFDRARYFLPVAAKTNIMLVMSARSWVQLVQVLASCPFEEANQLAEFIVDELEFSAPRMVKHATRKDSFALGLVSEFNRLVREVFNKHHQYGVAKSIPYLYIDYPPRSSIQDMVSALQYHDNRYSWVGPAITNATARFKWNAVSFAEIRDLNRHRTGTKYCPLVPLGFYSALDEATRIAPDKYEELEKLSKIGYDLCKISTNFLRNADTNYIYYTMLGTQYSYSHVTTLDKALYQFELRTGLGAHYKYKEHCHDVLQLLYAEIPEIKQYIIEGGGEPE